MKDDIKLPGGTLGSQITASFDEGADLVIITLEAMGEEHVSFEPA